jgi:hypothetical protein
MLSKIRERLRAAGQSLAGDGMLLRLRNASIALVATVAAVGLGLTLFISQLGFPAVFSSPIPGSPTDPGAVHDAIALTHSRAAGPSLPAPSTGSAAIVPGRPRQAGQGGGGSGGGGGGGSPQIAVGPGTQSSPAAPRPTASVPASMPATPQAEPSPSVPSPAALPAAVESPSKSSSDGQSKGSSDGTSKLNGPSTAKLTSDSNGKSGASSKGPQVSKAAEGNAVSVAKSNDSPAKKAENDQSTAAPTPVAPPPPAPEAVSPAAAKEAADSGKSGGPHH